MEIYEIEVTECDQSDLEIMEDLIDNVDAHVAKLTPARAYYRIEGVEALHKKGSRLLFRHPFMRWLTTYQLRLEPIRLFNIFKIKELFMLFIKSMSMETVPWSRLKYHRLSV